MAVVKILHETKMYLKVLYGVPGTKYPERKYPVNVGCYCCLVGRKRNTKRGKKILGSEHLV